MKLLRKLKSTRGESFVEILISILIVAIGCLMIAVMYTSAMNLNVTAAQKDEEFYKAVSQMEQMFENEPSSSKNAEIQDDGGDLSVKVDIYGEGANAAYKRH